jgi:hypothetical protein
MCFCESNAFILMMFENAHLTNPLIWTSTGIVAILDAILILLAHRAVNREQFRQMRWELAIVSGIFFLLLWMTVLWWAWDWFYSYIFPGWAHYLFPLLFGIGYGLIALGMGWLSLRLPGSPAVTWCILGGVEGLLSHIYAIYGVGAASKPPIMQGTDPLVVLIFAVFEIAFYWSCILLISRLIWKGFIKK